MTVYRHCGRLTRSKPTFASIFQCGSSHGSGKITRLFGVGVLKTHPRFVYALSVRNGINVVLFVREVLHRSCNPRLPPCRAHTSARRSERAHARGRTPTRDTAPRLHVEARTAPTAGRVSSRLGSSRKTRARLARGPAAPRDKVTGACLRRRGAAFVGALARYLPWALPARPRPRAPAA